MREDRQANRQDQHDPFPILPDSTIVEKGITDKMTGVDQCPEITSMTRRLDTTMYTDG